MPKIALVTSAEYADLTADDRILAVALRQRGADVEACVWNAPEVPWQNYDLAVLRSPWDYHRNGGEFEAWVRRVEGCTQVVNRGSLVLWNMNKKYLAELAARGVKILPSLFVDPGANLPLHAIKDRGWTDLVLKPQVGATAWQMVRTSAGNIETALTPHLQKNGYLVQPFSRAIHDGEYSLIFIGEQYSHAALKKPTSGDFRVQHDWGGSFGAASAKGDLVEAASAVLQVLPSAPAYARIDGVLEQGEFLLMEAELIEPDLFFRLCPASAARLADLLIALA